MAVCAITIRKTSVFEWFHFFHFFTKLVSREWFYVTFLCLLVTFGTLFLISEGIVIEHEIVIVGAIVIGLPWGDPG